VTPQNRRAAILAIVEQLREAGSWAGRTHIQKCLFLLRALFGLDLGFEYVSYKHGPYSFDLDADIEALRIQGALDYEIVTSEYGPRYTIGPAARMTKGHLDKGDRSAIAEVARFVGEKNVRELECLSTLVMCCQSLPEDSRDLPKVRDCVRALKPHLSDVEIESSWQLLEPYRGKLQDPPGGAPIHHYLY
jgi:uncharacterized protein YwgA